MNSPIGGGNRPFPLRAPENTGSSINSKSPSVQVADATRTAKAAAVDKLKKGGSPSFTTKELKDAITVVEKLSRSGIFFVSDNDKKLYHSEFNKGKSALELALRTDASLKKLKDEDNTWQVPGEHASLNQVRGHYERLAKAAKFLYDNRDAIASISENPKLIEWDVVYKMQQGGLLRTPPLPPLLYRGNKYVFAYPMASITGQTELVYKYKNEAMGRDDVIVIIEETGRAKEGKTTLDPAPVPVKERAR